MFPGRQVDGRVSMLSVKEKANLRDGLPSVTKFVSFDCLIDNSSQPEKSDNHSEVRNWFCCSSFLELKTRNECDEK